MEYEKDMQELTDTERQELREALLELPTPEEFRALWKLASRQEIVEKRKELRALEAQYARLEAQDDEDFTDED